MIKVEAVVIRERVETVIDAVEHATGHVGVTVIEAIGHGRQRGVTHEYRGRIFESRFLPKAHLTFIVEDELADAVVEAIADSARSGNESGDGLVWTSTVETSRTTDGREAREGGGSLMARQGSTDRGEHDLGRPRGDPRDVHAGGLRLPRGRADAHEERGAHRRQERPDLRRLLARLLRRRLRDRLRRRQRLHRDERLLPLQQRAARDRPGAVLVLHRDPGGERGYLFEVVFAGVSLAIVWGAMAERAKLWVYFAFGVVFTLIYSVTSHWIWQSGGWLFGQGMQDFAGSTVVHYQGALAALAGALLLGPRIGKFGRDGRANPIPGHNMPYAVLGTIILWFGWFGFNPGSTLGVVTGDRIGYFGYVALTTNIAAAAGAVGGLASAWWILRKPDISMMLNGVLAALVAITAASGFVAPWAAIVIGAVSGWIAVAGVLFVERIGIDDPIGAVAVHGMSGVWGTLATGMFAVPALADESRDRQGRARLHGLVPSARRPGARPRRRGRVHVLRLASARSG